MVSRTSIDNQFCRLAAFSLLLSRICFSQSYTGCNGRPATGELQLAIVGMNSTTGAVQVNGVDTRGPSTPFTWNWGDGTTTQGFFPQSHTYANVKQNYTLQVTSKENDGSTDCAQLSITFVMTPPVSGAGFLPPTWQAIGPSKVPNAHACDNVAEASLFAAGRIQAFAINLATPSVMYAGGGVGTGNSGPTSNAGVYKSTDGGAHWVAQDNGLTDRYIDAIWLDQSNPNTLLASTWFGGIFRSTDGAQSWTNVRASSTTSIVQSGAVLLAAAADGFVSSTDAGATWAVQKMTTSPVRTLACSGGACYAGLDDGTVLAQVTQGSPWSTVLPGGSSATAYNIAINPANPAEAIVVLLNGGNSGQNEGELPLGLVNLITQNGGASWSPFNGPAQQSGGTFNCSGGPAKVLAFDTANPNIIYGGFGGAMWASTNGGASWTPLHLYEDLNLVYPFPGKSGNLVVGGDQGIYMSQDGGATWASLNGDLTTSLLTHLAVNGEEIFTAVQDFSPIQSFDGGNSWLQLSSANPPVGEDGVVMISPGNPQYQYAFNGSGFWYSSDGGKNFTNDNANLTYTEWGFNGTTDYIAIDPSNPQNLYLVGNTGVFESVDYGVHWQPTGWPVGAPTFIVVAPNDSKTIFVGSSTVPPGQVPTGSVYLTHDGGLTWQTASLPANAQWPVSLAVDPTDSSMVVLGMTLPPNQPGGGILLSTDGGKTFSADNQGLAIYASASQHYTWSIRFAPPSLPHVVAAATTSGVYISNVGGAWTDITSNAITRWFSAIAWTGDSLYAATFGEGVLKASISAITPILSITPSSANIGAAGGTGSVAVAALSPSAAWTATTTASWIAVTSGASVSGNGFVGYSIMPNSSTNPRTGTIMIGGYTFTVLQAGAAPSTSSCAYAVSPTSLQAPTPGGNLTINIETTSSCSWAVSNLPSWITIPGASSGTGSVTVTLVAAPNSGTALSATIMVAGISVAVTQAASGGCTYAINPGGQAFSAAGGSGTITITAGAGCFWTAVSSASWITISGANSGTSNGAVIYQVAANTGDAQTGTITIGNLSFVVLEAAASIAGYTSAGSMAQLASAGSWTTTFTVVNTGSTAAQIRFNFFDNNGNPLMLPLTFPQSPNAAGPLLAATLDQTISPGAEVVIQSTGPLSQPTLVGWAQLLTTGNISGFALFSQANGSAVQDAEVPLDNRNDNGYIVPFDNTNGSATGIALANVSAQSAVVTINIRDATGALILSDALTLPAMGHTSFNLTDRYAAATAQQRGTLEFRSPSAGQISVLGLRFNSTGAFSTIPALGE